MLLIYLVSQFFHIFHQNTKNIKGDKVIYTITYLEQVSRILPIIFARRYNSHISFKFTFRYMRPKIRSFERCIDFICFRRPSYNREYSGRRQSMKAVRPVKWGPLVPNDVVGPHNTSVRVKEGKELNS